MTENITDKNYSQVRDCECKNALSDTHTSVNVCFVSAYSDYIYFLYRLYHQSGPLFI